MRAGSISKEVCGCAALRIVGSLAAIGVLLAACSSDTSPRSSPLATADLPSTDIELPLVGALVLRDRCLYVRQSDGTEPVLVLPRAAKWDEERQVVVHGDVTVNVDAEVRLTGRVWAPGVRLHHVTVPRSCDDADGLAAGRLGSLQGE